jgi:plasmid stability protein
MATLTIRNLPDDVVERIKNAAAQKGHSMEQEVRELLETRFQAKNEALRRIRERWKDLPETTPEEIERWIETGRS